MGDEIMSTENQGKQVKLSATIIRHYGNVDVGFTIESEEHISTWAGRRDAFNRLIEHLDDQHKVYASEHLHKQGDYSEQVDFKKPNAGKIKLQAHKLLCEVLKGKRYYSFIADGYNKHGVRVWGEVLEGTNVFNALGDDFSVDCKDTFIIVDTLSKPHKVIKILESNDAN